MAASPSRLRPLLLVLALLACFASSGGISLSELRRSAVQLHTSYDPAAVIPGRYAHAMVSEGRFISSNDMGVSYCKLFVNGAALGKALDYSGIFMLHVFLRYTAYNNISRIRGTVTVEPAESLQGGSRLQDVQFDPALMLHTWDNRTTFPINGTATFPFVPIAVSAAASPLASSFTIPADNEHEYYITSKGANSSCSFRPAVSPNQIDHRGVEVELNQDTAQEVKDAYVIMSPYFNLRQTNSNNIETFAVLLGRHIQWHRALGFARHIVYMRADDIMVFSIIPAVQHWLAKGYLLLVLWEPFPERQDLPLYDQRIVYSHAVLSFTGLDVYLAMMDPDEYVLSLRDDLRTIQEMTRACNGTALVGGLLPQRQLSASARAQASALDRTKGATAAVAGAEQQLAGPVALLSPPVNLLIRRYHTTITSGSRLSREADVWATTPLHSPHPLLRYTMVNRIRPPAVKAVVRPEFVNSYSTHGASGTSAPLVPEPDCLFVLHLKYMLHEREKRYSTKAGLRRGGYIEDKRLEQAVAKRVARLSNEWIPKLGGGEHKS